MVFSHIFEVTCSVALSFLKTISCLMSQDLEGRRFGDLLGTRRKILKVKSCYNPLRLGTVIVLVSSGIDFEILHFCIATEPPAKRDCQFGLMVCARGSPKCLDFTRNTPQLNKLCPR